MSRVLIISASIGSGHDAAATELARRLHEAGMTVRRVDFLDLLPGPLGAVLRAGYRRQLEVAPGSWRCLLELLGRVEVAAAMAVALCGLAVPAARRETQSADLTVSTYPLATQVLARLRRRGRLSAPVLAYLTDPSVHRLWLAVGVDYYLAPHPATAGQLRAAHGRYHRASVLTVAPAVRPQFRPPQDPGERTRARRAFDLPPGPLALVTSGSWAVGEVERTAREIAASGSAVPVVVCGDNDALRARLADLAPGVVFGWVADMATLMRAVDLAVLNSGGMTWAEAYASGLPVLHYRPLPGHATDNAALLDAVGQVPWVRRADDLPLALRQALAEVTPFVAA